MKNIRLLTAPLTALAMLGACAQNDEADLSEVEAAEAGIEDATESTPKESKEAKKPKDAATDKKEDQPSSAKDKLASKPDTSSNPSKADAGVKIARCVIDNPVETFDTDCRFIPSGGGSFSVEAVHEAYLTSEFGEFVVELDTKEVAGLSARTIAGELNYLGSAKRRSSNSPCWDGEDYSLCVHSK